jgi:hypothetical protein
MDEQNNNQTIINEEPVVVEKVPSKSISVVVKLIVAILILGGGFFAYASFFNPFLFKNNVDITKIALAKTQKLFSDGQFTIDSKINIKAEPSIDLGDVGELEVVVPIKIDVGEVKEDKTFNTHLSIGDIDFSKIFSEISKSNPGLAQINKGDFSVNLETTSINSDFFVKINKIPSMLAMFVNTNILNKWIKISDDFVVNSMAFINLPDQQKIELTDEQIKIIDEIIIKTIVEDSKPIIKREKTETGLKISYKYNLKDWMEAFLAAFKEIGNEIPEFSEYSLQYSEAFDHNKDFVDEIDGSFDISYYINKKGEIERIDSSSIFNNEAGSFAANFSANITKNLEIVINEPKDFISLEDLLKQIDIGLVF